MRRLRGNRAASSSAMLSGAGTDARGRHDADSIDTAFDAERTCKVVAARGRRKQKDSQIGLTIRGRERHVLKRDAQRAD